MIRIQKLKQPKKTSGIKLEIGQHKTVKGVYIENKNKFPIYVDTYVRKKTDKVAKPEA